MIMESNAVIGAAMMESMNESVERPRAPIFHDILKVHERERVVAPPQLKQRSERHAYVHQHHKRAEQRAQYRKRPRNAFFRNEHPLAAGLPSQRRDRALFQIVFLDFPLVVETL